MAPVVSVHMPAYCFDVIQSQLMGEVQPSCPRVIPDEKFPLFVTWKKGTSKHLRGCIGTFSNLSLRKGLPEYACISAFNDRRFSPIALGEVPLLHCSVSLLVNFEDTEDYRDWEIGVHGIDIQFYENGRRLTAVYLPEVAEEQGWNHVETLDNLMRKGGFQGRISEADRRTVRMTRFQSEKVSMSYDDYCLHKASHGERVPLQK
uniref:AMMECR1 domain-containing protein n=1 Tax=Steinernema glaseri TaxID=37863 RepID=A0A1I7ZTZ5_9BILA